MMSLDIFATYTLEIEHLTALVTARPKSEVDQALSDRTSVITSGEEITYVTDIQSLTDKVRALACTPDSTDSPTRQP